ncbi:hypothetical protein ACETRX_04165 [Labrys portucalensis]|uniref:Uncharacterized protein n=1 Tax=Labrys neptuniae TaxID=376174 RepID=A0ABV6Z9B8_9HYPH
MADHPILFSGAMIRALLAGTKTQTRRVIKPRHNPNRPTLFDGTWSDSYVLDPGNQKWREDAYPWSVGDRLWVRETVACGACAPGKPSHWAPSFWRREQGTPKNPNGLWYAADGLAPEKTITDRGRWVPGIHMPRWASRLALTVTGVKVERLQDISEDDAWAEGIIEFHRGPDRLNWPAASPDDVKTAIYQTFGSARGGFRDLWEHINGTDSWAENPWVSATAFDVHKQNIDALKEAA